MAKRVLGAFDLPDEGDIIDQVTASREQAKKKTTGLKTVTLDVVTGYYHRQLYKKKKGCAYLESIGITDRTLLSRYRIGYADGSILEMVSNGQREKLAGYGVLTPAGKEVFTGCVVFPFMDANGKVRALYGRKIAGIGEASCGAQGFFNLRACKVYDEVILTESVFDALTLIQLGIGNVLAFTGELTAGHIKTLKDNLLKTIVLALYTDGEGKKKADALRDSLVDAGFTVKVALPPRGKNWKDWLAGGRSKEEVLEAIEAAETFGQADDDTFTVRKQGRTYHAACADITYRIAGVKDLFVSNLRVSIKARRKDDSFYDTVDLYSARSRETFAGKLSRALDTEPPRIEKDLIRILEYLEKERDAKLDEEPEARKEIILTPEEREAGLAFLEDPELFDRIAEDMTALGYVNEWENKLIVYIASVSRFLKKPLNVYIQAGSSGGKSALLNTLEQLIPSGDIWKATTISTQALNYVEQEQFLGKVFFMGESIHDEAIEGLVRQMQSEGEISRLVTMKDERTGEMKAKLIKKQVRMCFMVTSTALHLNPENASRCLMLTADESKKQTGKVLERLGYNHGFEGSLVNPAAAQAIRRKHYAAQILLEDVPVFNPYWEHISFPTARPSMRRAYEQFLTMIDTICFLRQMQKPDTTKAHPETGEEITGKACDIEDYRLAYTLLTTGVLGKSGSDIPQGTRRLYEDIREMLHDRAGKENVKVNEISFIQKQVREHTQLGGEFIKKHMRVLVSYEYLQVIGGKRHGTRFAYRLREDAPIEELDISLITTPEELEARIGE